MFKGFGTRYVLLVLASLLALAACLLLIRHWQGDRDRSLYASLKEEKRRSLERILALKNAPLRALIEEGGRGDGIAGFLSGGDARRAARHIDPGITVFGADALWVLGPDYATVCSTGSAKLTAVLPFPVQASGIPALFRSGASCHFFVPVPSGALMEIFGAAVRPDPSRQDEAQPRGYVFAGRVWDGEYVKELSFLSQSSISVAATPAAGKVAGRRHRRSFALPLPGGQGKPAGFMTLEVRSSLMEEITSSGKLHLGAGAVIGGLVLLLIALFLFLWVKRPLDTISRSLAQEDPALLAPLRDKRSEFGTIARLIVSFFEQKQELVSQKQELLEENSERRRAEQQLLEAQNEMERRVQERTAQLVAATRSLQEEVDELKGRAVERDREWEAKLLSARTRMMGEMARVIAEEMKDPMNVAAAYARSLRERSPEGGEAIPQLVSIEREVRRCKDFIEGMLAFLPEERGQRERCDINGLVSSVLAEIAPKMEQAAVRLATELSDGLPAVPVSRVPLQQVLLNLCHNAVEAMPGGGTLTVRSGLVEAEGSRWIELAVRDTGAGIPDEIRERLFEPFFTTKERKGAGLGLSLAAVVVDRHCGRISVESAAGGGTVIRLRLPAQP